MKNQDALKKKLAEESIRSEFEQSFSDRVARHLEAQPLGVIPNKHFASVSSECYRLYRDGHYYGAISLAQSVVEALARFLSEKHNINTKNDFEKQIKQLQVNDHITEDVRKSFKIVWKKRNDFHHLNAEVESDLLKLKMLAKEKLNHLRIIEEYIFAHTFSKGAISPLYPEYWDFSEDGKTTQVFLRLD